ncbi:cobalamin biosynthesis protein [Nocardioides sp. T2.26MG-1]|uniref:cobalamin biosynthesis protein n=1 Tax=Nocardioides sp. T2.26MG-1 TaxID=3041166 RepID=UPI002477ACF5|nr:cobalamin biosynthesis protein [Nocardioides sp. T2.26MG-1]CAI9404006.1 Cobalamin biosynthesis protein CobD [Nocardioides sp. T2.26MG-1]
MSRSRAVGLLLGFVADRVFGDPGRGHPVAVFGSVASRLEARLYADSRARGVLHNAVLVGGCALLGVGAERATRGRPLLHAGATALATWTVLGGKSLEREAMAVHSLLVAGDLPGARHRLTYLVGRDTTSLSENEIARAVVESVAENTSDAVTAPLFWGAVAGIPGLLAHRAANTLDAMVGHHNPRYERFGWASARLDDLLGLPGSRYAALAVMVANPSRAGDAWRTWRRDAPAHPSPNAGVIEAAFAGSLGITLGGTNRYGDRVEHRPTMGPGRPVTPGDIPRGTNLAQPVGWVAAGGSVLAAANRRC